MCADARCREGKFLEMTPHIDDKKSKTDVDDSSDMSDTVDWLLNHVPNNNGKVGIWGISYPGFYTSASIIDSNPAIKAASPQAPMTNLFEGDDAYHGGAFMLSANFGFYTFFKPFDEPMTPAQAPHDRFDFGTPNTYEFYLKATPTSLLDTRDLKGSNPLFTDQLYHTTFDSYWKARDLVAAHEQRALRGADGGRLVRRGGPERPMADLSCHREGEPRYAEYDRRGTVGAWRLGARRWQIIWAMFRSTQRPATSFRKEIQFPFFEHYLKGKGEAPPEGHSVRDRNECVAQIRELAAARQRSRRCSTSTRTASFASMRRPSDAGKGYDEYVSDPMHPVPFVRYATDTVPQRYMVEDQRFAATRPDVLVYETDPLTEDVTIAGPITPKLKIASPAARIPIST